MSDYYLEKWAGEFGDKYTERCDVNYETRVPIFQKLLLEDEGLSLNSVLEVGCNKGHNLEAINKIYINASGISGIEPNKSLCKKPNIINGNAYEIPFSDNVFDLVFTSGVLIHIPGEKLEKAMDEMYRVSKKYIMMIEYPADEEKGSRYRDFEDKEGVWARPYGFIFQRRFPGAKLVKGGHIKDLGNDGWGFSDCDYWVFEK